MNGTFLIGQTLHIDGGAVRYQEFLDNIELSERVYHLGDPAAVIRHALASARTRDGPEKAVLAGLLR